MIARAAIHRYARPAAVIVAAATLFFDAAGASRAEVSEVRIAQQYGISYLPLTVMNHEKLLEAAAKRAGIADLKSSWKQFGAGNAMNEALLSGNLDFA